MANSSASRDTEARSSGKSLAARKRRNSFPVVSKAEQGGPLSRELVTVKVVRLVDFINRSASLAFPRVSHLSDFEWRVLAWVCETPPLSVNEISYMVHRDVAQVSRTVKKLVTAGFVHRASKGGGPGVLITPTKLGRTAYRPMVALARKRDREITAKLGRPALATLERCLDLMTRNTLAQLAREQRLQRRRANATPMRAAR